MLLPDLSTEIQYKAIRSSGAGGQHVNKTSTQVELRWSLINTAGFSESEIGRLSAKLASRLTQDGELILTDQTTRSQVQNRESVTKRFYDLLRWGLQTAKPRRATKPSAAASKERLAQKRRRGETKSQRGHLPED